MPLCIKGDFTGCGKTQSGGRRGFQPPHKAGKISAGFSAGGDEFQAGDDPGNESAQFVSTGRDPKDKQERQKALANMIDLRSDTVTRPSLEMRAAMAAAEVGDDVYGEDPTVNQLENRAAQVFGREAALFVPSGTMGNQIAIRVHTQPGQEVIAESRAHILDWEMATTAVFSGCLIRAVPAKGGILTWKQIEPEIRGAGSLRAATGLIEIENTHNMAGGVVTPLPVMEEIWEGARERKLPVHLDGARIFNAATALGVDVKTLTRGFDTVMFCLSKGLGAPVGSMLTGSAELIARARVFRKALGGGMRQVGILAAAGLLALEKGPARLHEDHANARLLAEALSHMEGVAIDLDSVETNIVIFRLTGKLTAAELVARLKARGILASAFGPDAIRLVTHLDVDRAACVTVAEALTEEIEAA
jgi:threonine aldolase